MKLLRYVLLALLAVPMASYPQSTRVDSVKAFFKKHQEKIAFVTFTLASFGLGSYITYHVCKRNFEKTKQPFKTPERQYTEEEYNQLSQELEKSKKQTFHYKEWFALKLENDFRDYWLNESSPLKDIRWNIEMDVRENGFKVLVKGDPELFAAHVKDFERGGYISRWPGWSYQTDIAQPSIWFIDATSGASHGYSYNEL